MKIGCFGFAGQLETIAKCGYDTAELDLTEINAMTDREFLDFEKEVRRIGLPLDVFSGLLPLSVRIHDHDFKEEYWLAYIEKAAGRAAQLGARMIPFGAGKCRSIPDGCKDAAAAKDRVAALVREICVIFKKYGLELVVEPLGPANSNYLNRIGDTCRFLEKIAMENCHTMCDLRHMVKSEDPFSEIIRWRKEILHAHIDYPGGTLRRFLAANDGYDYQPYIRTLRDAGYDGILTIEATSYQDFEKEAAESCRYLRSMTSPPNNK